MSVVEYENHFCKVILKANNEILAAGTVINTKIVPIECITFDNKYFFTLKENDIFYIEKSNETFDIIFNPKLTNIKITLWRDVNNNLNDLIFREYDITELDPEVTELVNVLNSIKCIRTTGSCSGHNKSSAFINIMFSDFNILRQFIQILSIDKFKNSFILSTHPTLQNNTKSEILLKLATVDIGPKAYTELDKLAIYLESVFE